jgi:O-methyltransferase
MAWNPGKELKQIIARFTGSGLLGDTVNRSRYFNKKQELVKSFSIPQFKQFEELYDIIIVEELKGEAINYLEFGVYKGNSINYWAGHYKSEDSRFYGFDTFTGLPEDWVADKPKGSYSANGKAPDINDKRVEFLVGLFSSTLPLFIENRLDNSKKKVIHMDADLYTSTMYVLNALLLKLKKGDIIIFDEWGGAVLHEFKAFHDFFSYSALNYVFIGTTIDQQGVAIKII